MTALQIISVLIASDSPTKIDKAAAALYRLEQQRDALAAKLFAANVEIYLLKKRSLNNPRDPKRC